MKFVLQRYSDNGDSTQGLFFLIEENALKFQSYAIEDENRAVKVPDETCIGAGLYELDFLKVETPKTKAYRAKYKWFTWHIEVKGVENFKNVYIHIGNKESHTSGCILLNDTANNNQIEAGFNGKSLPAFRRFYHKVEDAIANGEKVFLRVRDIKELY